mmetsp:Transcript_27404/g.82245  ORF Transcript_27404/g.82245 Transcript_27404/m.82245 type:complete len:101 (+) Transcript_27404:283-585(+)
MTTREQIVDKIRLIARQRRVRLNEFFLSFDSTGRKHCTPAQFRRGLEMSGVTREMEDVSEEAYAALTDYYADPRAPGYVRYQVFCAGPRPPTRAFARPRA